MTPPIRVFGHYGQRKVLLGKIGCIRVSALGAWLASASGADDGLGGTNCGGATTRGQLGSRWRPRYEWRNVTGRSRLYFLGPRVAGDGGRM